MTAASRKENLKLITNLVLHAVAAAGRNEIPTVNALARLCAEKGLKCDKQLVAQVRRNVLKGLDATSIKVVTEGPIAVMDEDGNVRIDIAMPKPMPGFVNPDQLAREREEKARRQAEREAEWAKRAAEREAEWARERLLAAQVQQEIEAAPSAPVAPVEAPAPEPLPAPVPPVTMPPVVAEWPSPAPTPTGSRSAAMRALKRQFVNEMLDRDPGMDPQVIIGRLKEKFGSSLDHRYIYDTCRVAREISGLPLVGIRAPHTRSGGEREPMPTFPGEVLSAPAPAPVEPTSDENEFAADPESDLAWLAQQARDIMRQHNLVELVLTMTSDSGEWEFKVAPRTGRGSMKF